MAEMWLKGPFQIITTLLHQKGLNEYARKHGETHPINITEDMVSDVKVAWKINAQWQRKEEDTRKCSEEK